MYSGGGAELTCERWREKQGDKEEIKVKEKHTDRYSGGGLMGNIGSAEIKNGLYSAVLQSGPHPLRRNSDDMTSVETSEAAAQKLRLTQISGS